MEWKKALNQKAHRLVAKGPQLPVVKQNLQLMMKWVKILEMKMTKLELIKQQMNHKVGVALIPLPVEVAWDQ